MVETNQHEYKGYNLGLTGSYALVQIKAKGQGTVPLPLRGMFTSFAQAQKTVDGYLNSLLKGKKNGKSDETKVASKG